MGHDLLTWQKQLLHIYKWHAASPSIATATRTQIWPYRKKAKGHPSIIIWTNLAVSPRYCIPMYTKIHRSGK